MKKKKQRGATVTWYGHSAFLLESSRGTRVLIDPWLDNPRAPTGARHVVNIDLILVTHGHDDHLGNTVEIAQATGATVAGIHEVTLYLTGKGVAKALGMNKGGMIRVRDVAVTMVDARHSSSIDAEHPPSAGGEAAGYVLQFDDGYCIYHAGDTAVFGDMQLIGRLFEPDLALLPVGDRYTMGPRAAAVACTLIRPGTIIGMHYGTFPALTGTPEELKQHLPASMRGRVKILEPGRPVHVA